MSSGKLITRHAYGVRSHSKNCLSYLDDHHLMYVAGNNVVIVSTESKDQSFIPGTVYPQRGLGITCISSSHPKKIIAVAEKTAENGIVTFYDSHSLRKKKTINHTDLGSKEIVSMAFSNDGKYFIMQGGAPEWNFCLWSIEKNIKLIYTYKSCHHDEQTVSAISFCPSDHTIMGIFGKSMGKLLKYQEGHIKAMSMSMRRDHANFTAHLWTIDDRCIVGTEAGEILLIDNLEFRTVVYPCGNDGEDFVPILSLAETSRGFVVGSISGELRVFEKAEDSKEQYSYADMYVLPKETSNVISLAMGLDDNVVSLTDSQQMFVCPLYSGNMVVKDKAQVTFDNVISSFHTPNTQNSAAIVSIDVAVWRPLLATCGKDCTARVWNLHERKVEVMLKYEEEPIAVGLHPSGLYMIVAFLDKIQVLSILLNELSHTRDLSIRQCSIVKFSKGGNFLAANSGSSINIFNFFTGEVVSTLRGHSSKIRSITWMNNDSRICSVGSEGAIFYWDVFPSGTKRPESLTKPMHVSAGTTFVDSTKAYVALPEKIIKELTVVLPIDAEVPKEIREIELGSFVSTMILDDTKKMLFAATADDDGPNAIVSFLTFPQLSSSHETAMIHSGEITCLCLSPDGNYIYSADSDGVIIISEIEGASSSSKLASGGVLSSFEFRDEVLVRKFDYESKKLDISNLTRVIEDLNKNNDHALRVKENDHKNKIRSITNSSLALLNSEKEKYAALSQEKKDMDDVFQTEILEMDDQHEQKLVAMDARYKTKLNAELVRQNQLKEEIAAIQQRWNDENQALVESHQDYIRALSEEYDEKLKNELMAQKTILSDKETMEIDYDRLNKRLDSNADAEIDDMKLKYAQRLKHEEDTVMILMSEHAVLKKSLQTLGKDASHQKDEIRKLTEREARLLDTVHSLEKDIVNHKKEIREREETITDKEKRIFDLKKKNQELEKFRFVLDYKIKELKMQIAPREEEIATMRKQIEDMDMELAQYHKSNAALNLMISELKLKVEGMRRELLVQTERYDMCGRLVTKYRRDLKEMSVIWDNSVALKVAVINMFRIYVQDDAGSLDSGKSSKKLEDPQLIYNRDREQLERSLDALRRAVKGDTTSHNRNVTKMLRENVILTTELNTLRKDYMTFTLKKKAIDESGALHGKPFNDIFDILGTKDPGEKYRKQQAAAAAAANAGLMTGDPNPNAGGIFATEGVEEMRAPSRGTAGSRSPRTVALRTTDANGRTRDTSPTSQQQTGIRRGGDQWDAWREIQMQNDQMMQLEEQLRNVCLKMSIDPVQVFKKLEETIAR